MTDPDAVRRGYDAMAATYAERRGSSATERALIGTVLEGLGPGDRVLDAGCGQGEPVLRRLADSTSPVGVDVAGEQLRLARAAAPAAATVQGDLADLPLAADRFASAVALHSLIHVPGGRLLLSEGTSEWVGRNPDWLETGVEMQWAIAGPEATRRQLDAAGFVVQDERRAGDALAEDDAEWIYYTARLETPG